MCLFISCDSLQNRFVPFWFAISFCKIFSFPSEATLFSLKILVIEEIRSFEPFLVKQGSASTNAGGSSAASLTNDL